MSKKKHKIKPGKQQPKAKPIRFAEVMRSPLIRFLGIFAAIMIVFYLIWWTPFFREHILYPWNGFNAMVSAWILKIFGFGTSAQDMIISGKGVALTIKEGCDAIEPAVLFAAAVMAFPAHWKKKLKGIAVGFTTLFGINLIRIISLFLIQKYWPAAFDFMHIQFWQVVFIILAVILWGLWMRTTSNQINVTATEV